MTDANTCIFEDGCFVSAHFSTVDEKKEIICCSMRDAIIHHESLVKKHWQANVDTKAYPFASLNTALFADGLFLYVADNTTLSQPLHLLFLTSDQQAWMAHPQHLVVLGKNSKLSVIADYTSNDATEYWMNSLTKISLAEQAQLDFCKIQNESSQAIHIATCLVEQKKASTANFLNFSFGGRFCRDDLTIMLQEDNAVCKTSGLYCLRQDQQYIDHHVDILHHAAHGESEMLYKGILQKKSRAVFNGKLHVAAAAKKTQAYQANHHLLLSPTAEAFSKPELEIYADEVKCKHGATTGQLDAEALFYLCSRGVPQAEAERLLLQGFANDVLQRVNCVDTRQRIQEQLL